MTSITSVLHSTVSPRPFFSHLFPDLIWGLFCPFSRRKMLLRGAIREAVSYVFVDFSPFFIVCPIYSACCDRSRLITLLVPITSFSITAVFKSPLNPRSLKVNHCTICSLSLPYFTSLFTWGTNERSWKGSLILCMRTQMSRVYWGQRGCIPNTFAQNCNSSFPFTTLVSPRFSLATGMSIVGTW